jgi:hypothetical protein
MKTSLKFKQHLIVLCAVVVIAATGATQVFGDDPERASANCGRCIEKAEPGVAVGDDWKWKVRMMAGR